MADNEQAAIWNDVVGQAWVDHATAYDATLEPFGEAALARLAVASGERVVDLGCGTGTTTLRLAQLAAPGEVVGVDISAPMLDAARSRAAEAGTTNVDFAEVDIERRSLGEARFDAAFSRFGVMFFDDPVRAFANVRAALVDGGRLSFVCFQAPPLNPFIIVPVFAAAGALPMPPLPGPTDPSPFAFADPDRVTAILTEAGFVDVDIVPGPARADLGAADDLEALATRLLEQNPSVAPTFSAADAAVRDAAVAATVDALRPHVADGRVALGAATWLVRARR